MKRTLMQAYVQNSVEAVALYRRAFGAELGYHVKGENGAYYHAELDVYGQILAVAEAGFPGYGSGQGRVTGNTMQFCLHFGEGGEDLVRKACEALREGGEILVPLGPCDFSPCMTDLIDRFGVRWCLFV